MKRLFAISLVALLTFGGVWAQTDEERPYKAIELSQVQAEANAGNAMAMNELGDRYYYGEGVAQSYAEAAKWYCKAAEQGHAEAQCNLGVCYYNGQGVTKSYAEAVKWWRKAAKQGYEGAKEILDMLGEDY